MEDGYGLGVRPEARRDQSILPSGELATLPWVTPTPARTTALDGEGRVPRPATRGLVKLIRGRDSLYRKTPSFGSIPMAMPTGVRDS